MKIEFLGTGGALVTPRPGCACAICEEAREKGVPYSRSGPSLFVHGPDLLVDTPEESAMQLNRARIMRVPHAIYSHWHPDHVLGRRVWEMNFDWEHLPPQNRVSEIYLPQQVATDFKRYLGSWEQFAYLEERGVVRVHVLRDGESITLGETRITPFRVAADYVYAFLLEENGKRVLIAPDELVGWTPPDFAQGVDLAVLPMGIAEFNPLTGERHIPAAHPILRVEATFRQTLIMVEQLQAGEVLLTHIEEADRLSYDDLCTLQERLQREGYKIRFTYDTLVVEV
jgi:phosphoribosyl 1,2-cyclic phosphate phosphodiesterase